MCVCVCVCLGKKINLFLNFNWRLITLQCCGGFCRTLNLLNRLGFLLPVTGRLTPSLPLGSVLTSPFDYSIEKENLHHGRLLAAHLTLSRLPPEPTDHTSQAARRGPRASRVPHLPGALRRPSSLTSGGGLALGAAGVGVPSSNSSARQSWPSPRDTGVYAAPPSCSPWEPPPALPKPVLFAPRGALHPPCKSHLHADRVKDPRNQQAG